MASLNHICMWSEHGWVRVTAEEAARKHPGGTVSVHSGLFMCELCGQYVTLTNGGMRVRYFKHSAYEANKNCPERTFGPFYTPTYSPSEHDLPIRIVLNGNTFSFEIGILYVPETILKKQAEKKVTITTYSGKTFVFSFERLNSETITYLPIGDEPSSLYTIEASPELTTFWPKSVKGIDSKGSLFEKRTGKMLPVDADVQVGRKYLLLTSSTYLSWRSARGLQVTKICEQHVGWTMWYVYEVEPSELSEEAAKFFLDIHYRLTDEPIKLTPIWPLHVETPYVIKHNHDEMVMYVSGNRDATPKTFPFAFVQTRACPKNGQVVKIACNGRQQLISAGSANVLQYMYLWREKLTETITTPIVKIEDFAGAELPGGLYEELPEGRLLRCVSPFDGRIIIQDSTGYTLSQTPIAANVRVTIPNIEFGMSIQVVQGLDIVWQSKFIKPRKPSENEDEKLVSKLSSFSGQMVLVDHRVSGIFVKLEDYPKTRQWLKISARSGYISAKAMKYLSKYISELRRVRKGEAL